MPQFVTKFLNQAFGAPFDRYDFFISYARADAADYVLNLQDNLRSQDYKCFLDKISIPAGASLTEASFLPIIERGLKYSKAMILVGTENALQSVWVSRELETFLQKKDRRVIAISVGGYLRSNLETPPFNQLSGLVHVEEEREAVTKGEPSRHALEHIQQSFRWKKRRVTLLRYLITMCVAMFALGLIVGLVICRIW
jgi:hypothetical protein